MRVVKPLGGRKNSIRHVSCRATHRPLPTPVRGTEKEDMMEFLVEFEVEVRDGTPDADVEQRERAEASAAAELVDEGHLVRL
jgi:hypothetical protein